MCRSRWCQAQAWIESAYGRGYARPPARPACHAADIQDATAEAAADAASVQGITLHAVKLPEAERGFVLLPRRRVVERSFAWATRCRRLVRDHERYAAALAGFHVIDFIGYMLKQAAERMRTA
jgi:transposase